MGEERDALIRSDVAARRLGVHVRTLYRWMRIGRVHFVQPGMRQKWVRESEIRRLLEERRLAA